MAIKVSDVLKLLLTIIGLAVAGVIFLLTGCICWFAPCDRGVHVSGHVVEEGGRPIQDARVEFYGVTRKTCADGCFRFGGVLAARGFSVRVTKPGYKSYEGAKLFAYYDLTVKLAPVSAAEASAAEWRELTQRDLAKYSSCPDSKQCNQWDRPNKLPLQPQRRPFGPEGPRVWKLFRAEYS